MNVNPGQQSGLRDLESIAQWGDALEIVAVTEPKEAGGLLTVEITLSLKGVARSPNGIPLRQRERFFLLVPSKFPFRHPSVFVPHQRWASWPHVQWTRVLCLYQAPETEWNPSDGMFGFIERLYTWVKQAAVDQLDPGGAPLHPPVAYVSQSHGPLVIPYVNTPPVENNPWIGFGCIRQVSDDRIDVVGWCELDEKPTSDAIAAAMLLPQAASFEFPERVRDLLAMLESQGVSRSCLIKSLGGAANKNGKNTQLLVLIGTPTRGISESGEYQQHLVAWLLDPAIANGLRLALEQFSPHEKLQEIGRECERIVMEWSDKAEVNWCRVREARPEVTVRRDEGSPLGWFRGKSVAIWGCGAIGGHVAEALARAGARKLVLWDKSVVTPGVLVRQPFEDHDIGKNKAVATRDRLRRIIPNLSVDVIEGDILDIPLDQTDWAGDVDMVIDATASWPVAQHLEARRRSEAAGRTVIASMVLGHRSHRALVYVAKCTFTGGMVDLARKTKIEILKHGRLSQYVDDFWPAEPPVSFQPEPGCSEPTFIGSQGEVMGLVGMMLSKLGREMTRDSSAAASSHLLTASGLDIGNEGLREWDFYFDADICLRDNVDGYAVTIAPQALSQLRAWVRHSENISGPLVETGGHIFGERNDAARIIWVSEFSGPPPDSKAGPSGFVCGIEGVAEASKDKARSSGGSIGFVGMWHTHPHGSPMPSDTDYQSMREIVDSPALSCPRSLLLIIGTTPQQKSFRATSLLFSRGRVPPFQELTGQAEPTTIPLPSSGPIEDVVQRSAVKNPLWKRLLRWNKV